jgi:hypothetical protein
LLLFNLMKYCREVFSSLPNMQTLNRNGSSLPPQISHAIVFERFLI